VEGHVAGFERPFYSGSATGRGVQLRRLLAALKLNDRLASIRDVNAFGDAHASFSGRLDALQVVADASGVAVGSPSKEIASAQPTPFRAVISGPLKQPDLLVSGTVPVARYRGYEARQVTVNLALVGGKGSAD